jgi:Domain of unknown function (DUF4307)
VTDPRPTARPVSGRTDLDTRYGRPRPGRKPLTVGVVGVLALAGLVWLAWAAFVHANPAVSSRLVSFKVTSPAAVTATIEVERDVDVEATCNLQAKAADFAIVGEVTVPVPAGAPRRQSLDATLTTQREATAVVLVGCSPADPASQP